MEKFLGKVFYYTHKTLKIANLNSVMYKKEANPIDHIVDNLYLGDFRAADDINLLKENGITHIVNCAINLPEQFCKDLEYLSLKLRDNISQDLTEAVSKCIEFISKASEDSSAKIFLHCVKGASRSAAILIAYLIVKKQMTYEESLKLLIDKRGVVKPNANFALQLKELEEKIKISQENSEQELNNL